MKQHYLDIRQRILRAYPYMEQDDDFREISERTLHHYDEVAPRFFAGTIDHDVSQNISALLDAIEAAAPYTILDLGCGPGRDLKTFRDLGHRAIGLDGSEQFVEMAHAYSGCEVWHQNFIDLHLPDATFEEEVKRLDAAGKLIEAIKLYRARTGCGLKEAKDAVERIAGR